MKSCATLVGPVVTNGGLIEEQAPVAIHDVVITLPGKYIDNCG
jgi:hypothetical protein